MVWLGRSVQIPVGRDPAKLGRGSCFRLSWCHLWGLRPCAAPCRRRAVLPSSCFGSGRRPRLNPRTTPRSSLVHNRVPPEAAGSKHCFWPGGCVTTAHLGFSSSERCPSSALLCSYKVVVFLSQFKPSLPVGLRVATGFFRNLVGFGEVWWRSAGYHQPPLSFRSCGVNGRACLTKSIICR